MAANPQKPPVTGQPITRKEYLKFTDANWRNVRCRTLRELHNGYVKMPKGTVVIMTRKSGWFEIEGPKCDCCGIKPMMRKVMPADLEILPYED